MKKNLTKWFTLIELMAVMTIMAFLVMTVAIPYMFYQNKARVRVTKKEITQILYEARNMAINGFSSGSVNQSIGLLFDTKNSKTSLSFLAFPFSATWSDITLDDIEAKIIKKIDLEPWMQIDSVWWKKTVLFFFQSVYWDGKYYSWNDSNIRQNITDTEIPIIFSFKWAWTWSLQSSVTYYTKTNIVDY